MQEVLNYLFVSDIIDRVEGKYYDLFKSEIDKIFLYANFKEMPLYYRFYSGKNYNLYKKLKNDKIKDVVDLLQIEILENDYNTKYILFAISYVSTIIFDAFLSNYMTSLNIKNKSEFKTALEKDFYEDRYNNKIKKLNVPKHFNLGQDEDYLKLIDKLLSNIYYFSNGKKVYQISISKYKKYKKKYTSGLLFIKKPYLKFVDLFRRKQETKAIDLVYRNIDKYDTMNIKKKRWTLFGKETDDSFKEAYDKLVSETVKIVDMLCEGIYYKKKMMPQINKKIKEAFDFSLE